MEKVVCIIPARIGSKRLKNKNIRPLNGKPLIAWTLEEARKSHLIGKIIVSTDDQTIADIGMSYDAEVIKRPRELASDTAKTIDAVIHVLDCLKQLNYHADHVVLLQCTSPFRTRSHIDEALAKYLKNLENFDSLISVTKTEHPPWWVKSIGEAGQLVDIIKYDRQKYSRAQDFPDVYRINGAIYIAKVEKLLEFNGFQTARTLPYIMEPQFSIDIDSETDFMFAEFLMGRN
jgi:CMP-N-acetylneuraminic acid synthetase